ncbi:MAG: tetratricopeptide repeat protein [candidate division WOR-3 bacterium]
MAEQDFTEIARLAERYNKDPKSRIFVQLADAYRKNNMVDEALEVLKQGLQHHPQYPLAYLILGKCYFDKRMYGQAREALEKTIEFDPVNIVALRMLAQVCENLKDEACQIKAYKGIVSIDPSDELAKNKLTQLEAGQRKGEIYTLTLAQEYEKQGNLEEALKVYEHLSFMDPTDLAIKHKVNELKNKISGVVQEIKKDEETKVAEMKLESYFQPEDIATTPEVEMPQVPEPQLGEHIIDLDKTPPPVIEEIKPVITQEQPVIEEAKPEPVIEKKEMEKIEDTEEVLSLEEFLAEPVEQVPETKPAPVIEEEIHPDISVKEPEKTPVSETFGEQFKIEEPETPLVEKPSKAETEETQSIQDLLISPVEQEIKQEPEPVREIVIERPPEKIEEPKEPLKTAEEKPVESQPAQSEEEKKKEEPPKPKEEDFKSFQDWLSSLLK